MGGAGALNATREGLSEGNESEITLSEALIQEQWRYETMKSAQESR